MIIGPVVTGVTDRSFAGEDLFVINRVVPRDTYLTRIGALLQGSAGDVDQRVRAVLYSGNNLVAFSDETVVMHAQPEAWLWFPMPALPLAAGTWRAGLHMGPAHGVISIKRFANGSGSYDDYLARPYAAGPPALLDSGDLTSSNVELNLVVETHDLVRVPTDVTDDYLATLPFDLAQRTFRAGATLRGTRRIAVAGWFGTTFDPHVGSVCLVRAGGPLADLVGERLLVSRRGGVPRSVAVYATDVPDFPDDLAGEDLLLSARAFLALDNPGLDDLEVTVEILG